MTMSITTSQTNTSFNNTPVHATLLDKSHGDTRSAFNELLNPEQKNTLQDIVDNKMLERTENIKENYQTAKDIDLMRAYYEQQQKLFDIYLETSTGNQVENSSNPQDKDSAISTLTDTYAQLYDLHKGIRDGKEKLTDINDIIDTAKSPVMQQQILAANNQTTNTKQIDSYNELRMPSTSSYMHLSV